ncbi:MAG TPA: zinc-finger domain-containing protein [Ramlibacter sp.]|nr:zinc-finger domain-containing protein [Ramlibacter sp.]
MQASARKQAVVELLAKDLNANGGIYCPSPVAGMKLWNTHPRVFLDVGHSGEAKCAYCGTVYRLKEGEHFGGGH